MSETDSEIFFKVMSSPFFWRQKAEELKFSAELLWPHIEARMNKVIKSIDEKKELDINTLEPDIFSIFMSLIGSSTEALLKGIIIRDNPSFVSNGKLASKLTTHDLIVLANIAKIPLSQNEEIFCKQAYKAMMYESRYPIPKEKKEQENSSEIGGHCKEVFIELYNKLYPTID